MEKERRTKALVIVVMLIVVAGLTVAFASLSSVLNIKGTAYLDAAKWGIKFENLSEPVKTGTARVTGTATIEEAKSAEISNINVNLSTPGDKVVYTVDLVNEGTINAKIDKIEKTELTEEQQKYLTFKVTDKDYNEVSKGDILSSGETKKLIITIEFIKDLTKEDLPTNTSTISLSYKLNFVQTDDSKTTKDEAENFNSIVESAIKTVTNNSNGTYRVYNLPSDSNILGVSNSLNGRIVINEEKETQIALYDEYKTHCALKKYYDKNFDVVSYSDKCIPESADNLVKNGYGEYGDNTNFSDLSYDKENGYFYIETNNFRQLDSSDLIRIDTNKEYHQSIMAMDNGLGSIYYSGIIEFDTDKKLIESYNVMYSLDTTTYLTEDLDNDDKVVHINDVSNFVSEPNTQSYKLGLIFWNYVDSKGNTYSKGTYSKNAWLGLYTYDNINKENNTITLKEKWNHGTIKTGTFLNQTNAAATYNYGILSKNKLNTSMTLYENNITGMTYGTYLNSSKFRYGTRYVKPFVYNNFSSVKGTVTYYKNFVIKEVRQTKTSLFSDLFFLSFHFTLRI